MSGTRDTSASMSQPALLKRQLAALGRFVHVYVDAATRRPVPVPHEVRRALEALSV